MFLLCNYQTHGNTYLTHIRPMETHDKEVKESTKFHGWSTKGSQMFELTS